MKLNHHFDHLEIEQTLFMNRLQFEITTQFSEKNMSLSFKLKFHLMSYINHKKEIKVNNIGVNK